MCAMSAADDALGNMERIKGSESLAWMEVTSVISNRGVRSTTLEWRGRNYPCATQKCGFLLRNVYVVILSLCSLTE